MNNPDIYFISIISFINNKIFLDSLLDKSAPLDILLTILDNQDIIKNMELFVNKNNKGYNITMRIRNLFYKK